ncbi:hypothetical protein BP5796_12449 [Coleophoma crateriformis]|uniref:Heterokaryon incompatibility domain-containing protein n=1 Tax=Coleophoma crateriformis TaxID=565419 RepID=A0A3D8Q9P1_9HELO|nr:hypothetical protein BP5796_12449 [Coleophoma crateriformis]
MADLPEDSDEEGDDKSGEDETANDASTQLHVDNQVLAASYQYTRLPNAQSYIRLLELQAGQVHDVIVCRLKEAALNGCINEYDALDYTWGPPGGKSRSIQVDSNFQSRGQPALRAQQSSDMRIGHALSGLTLSVSTRIVS